MAVKKVANKVVPQIDVLEDTIIPVETITEEVLPVETKEVIKDYGLKLFDTLGNQVDIRNYFYVPEGDEDIQIPPYFTKVYGKPVDTDREDVIGVFHKIFRKEDGFLLYKAVDKELYSVIVPIKFSSLSPQNGSVNGETQVHAMSFISEGGVNPDSLEVVLNKIARNIAYKK